MGSVMELQVPEAKAIRSLSCKVLLRMVLEATNDGDGRVLAARYRWLIFGATRAFPWAEVTPYEALQWIVDLLAFMPFSSFFAR